MKIVLVAADKEEFERLLSNQQMKCNGVEERMDVHAGRAATC